MIRHVDRYDPASKRQAPVSCRACGAETEHGKPYCPQDIERMPYVAALLERIAQREGSRARAV